MARRSLSAERKTGANTKKLKNTIGLAPQRQASELNRVIHEPVRLGIVSALAVNASMSFRDLKELLNTTDGNLSVHARKLEDAAYITCTKHFEGRTPKTEFQISAGGRKALESYLDHMDALIKATRHGE